MSSFSSAASWAGGFEGARGARRVAEDARDPRVRVLDVVDRVLLRLLGREVDVDVDRLVGPAVDEVPAGRVDADLVLEVVEEHDVAAALRDLRLLTTPNEMDQLVEEHLDALRVVAEHARDGGVPPAGAVMVRAEDVDRPVEAALELVDEVHDVGGAIRGRPALLGRADDHAVVVVAVLRGSGPDRPVLLVGVQAGARARAAARRARSAAPTSRSGSGSARATPRSARASAAPGRPRASPAPRRTRPDSRLRAALPHAGSPRPRPGSDPSARPRRCSSTRARPCAPRGRGRARPSRRRPRFAPRRP